MKRGGINEEKFMDNTIYLVPVNVCLYNCIQEFLKEKRREKNPKETRTFSTNVATDSPN